MNKVKTIGIISPGFSIDENTLKQGISILKDWGFKVIEFGTSSISFGRMTGTDIERARSLEEAFMHKDVDILLCCRGGYGSGRLLRHLNFRKIANNPKPIIGYSDITNLLFGLSALSNIPVTHGPMLVDLVNKGNNWTKELFLEYMHYGNHSLNRSFRFTENIQIIKKGKTAGKIFGGNLTTISSLLGTKYFELPDDNILFIEDVNEFVYKIDRMLVQLLLSGHLSKTKGILFADLKVKDVGNDNSLGIDLMDMIQHNFADFEGPIAYGLPCCHTEQQMTIPFGANVEMHCSETDVELTFLASEISEVA